MGGVGSGGRRIGAGRKPKAAALRAIDGNAGHRPPKVVQHPNTPPPVPQPPLDESDAPADFTFEQRAVWLELAPQAMANGTLTPATALGFRMLCRNAALLREYDQSVQDRGGANHRGLMKEVRSGLKDFNLEPFGKPVIDSQPQKPAVDPVKARFFGGR